jgi:hypothetical protein
MIADISTFNQLQTAQHERWGVSSGMGVFNDAVNVENVYCYGEVPEGKDYDFDQLIHALAKLEKFHKDTTDGINYLVDMRESADMSQSEYQAHIKHGRQVQQQNREQYKAGKQKMHDDMGIRTYSKVFRDIPKPGTENENELIRRFMDLLEPDDI